MTEQFNASIYLLDRHVEAGNGDRIAVTGPRGTYTYAQLLALVQHIAAGLRDLGVRREERVLLLMVDSPNLMAAILAAMRMGAVPVPVSTMGSANDLRTLLRDSRARALVVSEEFVEVAREAVHDTPDLDAVVVDAADGTDLAMPADRLTVLSFADLLLAGLGREDSWRAADDTNTDSSALWLYTSGTTGTPKAAVHRHGSIRAVAETYAEKVLGIRPNDRCLSVAKLFFAYGLGNSCFFPLSVGASVVLEPARPTPAGIAARLADDSPTLFFAVPTFFAGVLAADVPKAAFSSVRLAVSAGEPLPAGLYERFVGRYGLDLIDGIGATEALHIFLSNRPGEIRPGTTGNPVPGYDVRIVDDSGTDLPAGQPGNLLVRGESIALGYWCRTDISRRVFQGEWLRTGDTYVASPDGFYTYLGRTNDMMKAGGIWVSPTEVEAVLLEHPAVVQAAVVAVPDADGIEKPVACVVCGPDPKVDSDELVEFCRTRLPAFKRPRAVLFFDELAMTATGKLRRFAIRDRALNAFSTGVPGA